MFQDILEARTAAQFEKDIEDAAPVDLNGIPQLVRSDAPPRSQERLVIRPRQSGWMLTRNFAPKKNWKNDYLTASLE